MTRTARNPYPAAVLKDRHSRTGIKQEDVKGGAGVHNWGSFSEEANLEYQANQDAQEDMDATEMFGADGDDDEQGEADDATPSELKANDKINSGAGSDNNDDPTNHAAAQNNAPPFRGRRTSSFTEEEKDRARVYREGAPLKHAGVDLAHIARTSYGIARSPPNDGVLSTSPLRAKAGFSTM